MSSLDALKPTSAEIQERTEKHSIGIGRQEHFVCHPQAWQIRSGVVKVQQPFSAVQPTVSEKSLIRGIAAPAVCVCLGDLESTALQLCLFYTLQANHQVKSHLRKGTI